MTRHGIAVFADLLRAKRKGESAAEKSVRHAEQAPAWALTSRAAEQLQASVYEGRPRFMAEVKRLGVPCYWVLVAWAQLDGRGSPSTWALGERPAFLARLRGGAWPELLTDGGEAITARGRKGQIAEWVSRCPSRARGASNPAIGGALPSREVRQ